MKKKVGIIKRALCIGLVFLLSINSFAAVVSDNDGSAFITKAEFDSLKNSFQSQIDTYNTSIDSKIDGAIAAYLAGIKTDTPADINLDFLNSDYCYQQYIVKPPKLAGTTFDIGYTSFWDNISNINFINAYQSGLSNGGYNVRITDAPTWCFNGYNYCTSGTSSSSPCIPVITTFYRNTRNTGSWIQIGYTPTMETRKEDMSTISGWATVTDTPLINNTYFRQHTGPIILPSGESDMLTRFSTNLSNQGSLMITALNYSGKEFFHAGEDNKAFGSSTTVSATYWTEKTDKRGKEQDMMLNPSPTLRSGMTPAYRSTTGSGNGLIYCPEHWYFNVQTFNDQIGWNGGRLKVFFRYKPTKSFQNELTWHVNWDSAFGTHIVEPSLTKNFNTGVLTKANAQASPNTEYLIFDSETTPDNPMKSGTIGWAICTNLKQNMGYGNPDISFPMHWKYYFCLAGVDLKYELYSSGGDLQEAKWFCLDGEIQP